MGEKKDYKVKFDWSKLGNPTTYSVKAYSPSQAITIAIMKSMRKLRETAEVM